MKVLTFFKGKKTYLSALILFLLGIYGVWTGMDMQVSAIAFGLAFTAIGLGAKSDRYAKALQGLTVALHKHQAGQPLTEEERSALIQAGVQVALDASGVLGAGTPAAR